MYQLTHGTDGPQGTGTWVVRDESGAQVRKLAGKEASLLSLLLSGYELARGAHPLDVLRVWPQLAGSTDSEGVSQAP